MSLLFKKWVPFLVFSSLTTQALAWVELNDSLTRLKIDALTPLSQKPTATYPLSTPNIQSICENYTQGTLGDFCSKQIDKPNFEWQAQWSQANHEPFIQDPQRRAQKQADASIKGHYQDWSAQLSVQLLESSEDNQETFDHSFIQKSFGQWSLGIGSINRWWGPGLDSTLILSNQARPVPQVFLQTNQAQSFETPWLKFLGHWELITFMGQLEKDRAIPNALLWGLRINSALTPNLQIGLSRAAMWGGEGRPENLDTFGKVLLGTYDNREEESVVEPGNQLGGIDFKYHGLIGLHQWAVYGEFIGEDEANMLPSKKALLGGFQLIHPTRSDGLIQLFLEYTDTAASADKSEQHFNTFYEHSTYASGYRFHGQSLGSRYDNDAQVMTLGMDWVRNQDDGLSFRIRKLNLNRDNLFSASKNTVASTAQFGYDTEIQYQWNLNNMGINLGIPTQVMLGIHHVELQQENQFTLENQVPDQTTSFFRITLNP
jgi:hypothetical protein